MTVSTRPKTGKKSTYKERLAKAKLPRRTVRVCLRGDLHATIEDLANELQAIQDTSKDDNRFIGDPEAVRISAEIEQLRAEMRDSVEKYILQALPKDKWNDLRALHPPRDTDPRDKPAGVNVDTFAAALLPLSIVEPEMDEEDWENTQAMLTDRQYGELVDAAWDANQGAVSVPFSPAASRIQKSASESKRQSV